MQAFDIFNRQVLRGLTTLVIPGAVILASYLALLAYHFPGWADYWLTNPGSTLIIVLVVSLAAGMIIDNLGGLIESRILDKILSYKDSDHMKNWEEYLACPDDERIVAYGYLRSLLLRMKFELNLSVAFILAIPGLYQIGKLNCFWSSWAEASFLSSLSIFIVIILYLLWESYQSAKNLSKVRSIIIDSNKP